MSLHVLPDMIFINLVCHLSLFILHLLFKYYLNLSHKMFFLVPASFISKQYIYCIVHIVQTSLL